ncbi:MAG: HAMP domain-containing histidine kinase [Dehalococcoidia bacterium]|nr:HAMP domain-containing histidine kinase [Dehalococcoidia bacterium]
MFQKARLRLALWFAGVMAVVLLVVGTGAYLVSRRELDEQIDDSIALATEDIDMRLPWRDLPSESDVDDPYPDRGHDRGPKPYSTDVWEVVLSSEGDVLMNQRELNVEQFPVDTVLAAEGTEPVWVTFTADGEHYRAAALAVESPFPGQAPVVTVVGRSLEARDYQLRLLAYVLAGGGLGGVAMAAVGGFWLAGRALVPIRTSLETQRRFISDASHELRTPIAVMKANAELLLRHPEQSVEANIDQVAAINEESDHLTRLVGDLLTLARADEQRLDVVRQEVDLDEVLGSLVRDMGALAEAKGVQLTGQFTAGEVEGDPQRLRQLTAILLDNALKYTPEGGRIDVRASRQGSRVTLSVSDTGPGIAPEHLGHIFDRFYRADTARAPQTGTGLGLAIAKWIAEAHNGRIAAESQPGHGATFTVRLPRGHVSRGSAAPDGLRA